MLALEDEGVGPNSSTTAANAGKSESASKDQAKPAAKIIAQDQVGPEFDPLANSEHSSDQDESDSKDSPQADSDGIQDVVAKDQADSDGIQDVVAKDQGGQDFEPLKAKRIVGNP